MGRERTLQVNGIAALSTADYARAGEQAIGHLILLKTRFPTQQRRMLEIASLLGQPLFCAIYLEERTTPVQKSCQLHRPDSENLGSPTNACAIRRN
jgi:hypothetical protein